MNVYVYICIHTDVQTLVNVYINVYLYNTYMYISTYIYLSINTYAYIHIVKVSFSVCCGVLDAVYSSVCGTVSFSVNHTLQHSLQLQCAQYSVLQCVWQGGAVGVTYGV